MWLVGLLAAFVVLVWLVIMGLAHLGTRYQHSPLSRRVLVVEGVVSAVVAVAYSAAAFALPWWATLLVALPVAVLIFVAVAVTTLELWKLWLQRDFDRQIDQLEQAEAGLLAQLDHIRDQVHAQALRLRESETRSRQADDERRRLQQAVDRWQQGPGVARVRALRVSEWEEEYGHAPREQLHSRQRELEQELALARRDGDGEREHQVEAELAVVRLRALERELPVGEHEPGGSDLVDRLLGRQEEVTRELGEVRRQLGEWKRKKADFLARRIKL